MRFLSIIGTRPQYIKLAGIDRAMSMYKVRHDWLDTGQHYSSELSQTFVNQLKLPRPLGNFKVGSGTHAKQIASVMQAAEDFLSNHTFDGILVYGDTNSTLGACLASAKMNIPTIHIEAGLRSGNRNMPEEQNRIVVDHLSHLLLCPTESALLNLRQENLRNSVFVGDITLDVIENQEILELRTINSILNLNLVENNYVLVTLHRVENTNTHERLKEIFRKLSEISYRVLIIAHPRLIEAIKQYSLEHLLNQFEFVKSVDYFSMIGLIKRAKAVITDSGGVQKDAFYLGTMCITARSETEWPETLVNNANILNFRLENLSSLLDRELPKLNDVSAFGGSNVGKKAVDEILIALAR